VEWCVQRSVGGLVYAAVVGGVVSTALWGRSMVRLGSWQTMVYAYLEPVSAVVIAAIVLGESLSAIQAAGALLTLIGVWLASDSRIASK
jgi:probable blue pigment (indigoidine) exporter